jgi:hypothetical protein
LPDEPVNATDDPPDSARRIVPFWVAPLVEIALAFVLVQTWVHVSHGDVLLAVAVVLLLLAVTVRGPVGIAPFVPPRLHLVLVALLAVLAGLAPVLPRFRPDVEGIVVLEVLAVGLLWLAMFTRPKPKRVKVRKAETTTGEDVIDARVIDEGTAQPAPTVTENAARRLGRTAGVVGATGREAVHQHGPAVEDVLKRGLRRAGKTAGKWMAAPPDEDSPEAEGEPGTAGGTASGPKA